MYLCIHTTTQDIPLFDLAWEFSPLVETTRADTVVLELRGNTPADDSAQLVMNRARELGLDVSIAVSTNADAAILIACACTGITIIRPGGEAERLSNLPLTCLESCLSVVDVIQPPRLTEIIQILDLWGIRTLGELGALPEAGISERLGPSGVILRQLARGEHYRHLHFREPAPSFSSSEELDSPIETLDQMSPLLAHLMKHVCSALRERGLATNEIALQARLEDRSTYERRLKFPFPTSDIKWLTRRLLIDIDNAKPRAGIQSLTLIAEPAPPRVLQTGLFEPVGPEIETIEITLAKLVRLVGEMRVGSPEVLDSHKPDSFHMKSFAPKKPPRSKQSRLTEEQPLLGFRFFRPSISAEVRLKNGTPAYVRSRAASGEVLKSAGPWRSSGDWQREMWRRDEWDALLDQGLYRLVREGERWSIEGMYD